MSSRPAPRSEYVPAWLGDLRGRTLAVLGADGFIGSHVTRLALRAGADVTALCVKEAWRLADLDSPSLGLEQAPRRWWEHPISGLLETANAVALLAYEPPPEGDRLQHELAINAGGAERVAQAAADVGARVVFTSSADVYGPWHDNLVSEETTPEPATPYAQAKLEAESRLGRFGATSLRIATVYGPGEDGPRAIPAFARALRDGHRPRIDGDGTDVRDYVHVTDVAAAIVNAAAMPPPQAIINIASGAGRSTLDVFTAVREAMGAALEPEFVPRVRPQSRLVLGADRAREWLGFEPRADFEAALEEEVRWLTE